jgi:hypothetical protein
MKMAWKRKVYCQSPRPACTYLHNRECIAPLGVICDFKTPESLAADHPKTPEQIKTEAAERTLHAMLKE